MKEGFLDKIVKAIEAKGKCDSPNQYCTISIEDDWKIKIYAHPSEDNLHQTVAALTSLTGKMEKRQEMWGSAFEFFGENENYHVTVKTPEQCKIVGYKIEKRPKKVMVESSEMEIVKTAVTDCDFRAGKVKAGEFEPLQPEAVA